jgi:hypothetical protein
MADEEQLRMLKQGVEVWNAWRQQTRERINLSNANLGNADLGAGRASRSAVLRLGGRR